MVVCQRLSVMVLVWWCVRLSVVVCQTECGGVSDLVWWCVRLSVVVCQTECGGVSD